MICAFLPGLKDLRHLQWLSLANNKLKSLQNIQFSVSLVHLDVSDNQIANLMDLSSLTKLKTLLLNRNSIQSLERAPLYLPAALSVLGLAENKIGDLTMVRCFSVSWNSPAKFHINSRCETPSQIIGSDLDSSLNSRFRSSQNCRRWNLWHSSGIRVTWRKNYSTTVRI